MGYDLQLDLIDGVINGTLNDLERKAFSCIFDELKFKGLRELKPSDDLDVRIVLGWTNLRSKPLSISA